VNTRIFKIDLKRIIPKEKKRVIVSILRNNGVIVYPTETFYGLGANCFSPGAVKKIFALKRRDPEKPLSVVISDRQMLDSLVAQVPSSAESFLQMFWPGPLTLIFPASPLLPEELLGEAKSIGVRLPAYTGLRELVKCAGFPITATSANISGEQELSNPERVIDVFAGKVDCIIDGGSTKGGRPSTVVDLTPPKPRILRDGAIPATELLEILNVSK
jgi:L-threonylcarbamoyladenylate synthase